MVCITDLASEVEVPCTDKSFVTFVKLKKIK